MISALRGGGPHPFALGGNLLFLYALPRYWAGRPQGLVELADWAETKPGRDVFRPYFRRTLSKFSRLGARVLWMGHARGVVTGTLDIPRRDHIMAVLLRGAKFTDMIHF